MKKNLLTLFAKVINFFLIRIFKVRVVRVYSVTQNSVARKMFSKCKLEYSSERGFYFLKPMPSLNELNDYYSSLYWGSRAGKNYGIKVRDIIHYNILDEFIAQKLKERKVFLNFGAGNAGISHLMWMQGMEVINVEPSFIPKFYNERWLTFKDINQVKNKSVDVLYGSHSLEHVQDIDTLKSEASRVLKPGGYIFWEVPNAKRPSNGAQKGRVDIPHTYYFETKFFKKWFTKCLICSGYTQTHDLNVIQDWKKYKNQKGDVIRALGQID